MPTHRTLRAWAAVHSTRPAAGLVALSFASSLLLRDSSISTFGPIRFLAPVSSLLMIPVVVGVAVATACDNQARLPLPRPWQSAVMRAIWLLTWTALGVLALTVTSDLNPSGWALMRNCIVHISLAGYVMLTGFTAVMWLPSVALTLGSIVFGASGGVGQYYWWAVTLQPSATGAQGAVAGGAFACLLIVYCLKGPTRRLER